MTYYKNSFQIINSIYTINHPFFPVVDMFWTERGVGWSAQEENGIIYDKDEAYHY